ncbi:hypothetical protein EV05_0861 [Prochlorococcus sp. MIT 0601]|nr:hypothetical protein EV05_0861 [Prochlorococcus sp. MIT 0601]
MNILQKFRDLIVWFWKQEGTPAKRARGLAVGVFSGCFPFFGLQTLIGIFLATIFRANHLLAIAGTWISNPFTYFPLYWLNYRVGEVFVGEGNHLKAFHHLTRKELWDQGLIFSSRILLGSSIVGLITGIISGLTFYAVLKFFLKKRKPLF